jgi:hypothetical protein
MFNRHQILMAGCLVLALGAQFRLVQTYVFADSASSYIEPLVSFQQPAAEQVPAEEALSAARQYVLHIPDWMGWLLLSIGGALVLHSLSIPRIKATDPGAAAQDR